MEKLEPTGKYNQENIHHLIIPLLGDHHHYHIGIFLSFFFKKNIYLFIYGCVGSSLLRVGFSCGEQGLLFVAVRRLLTAVASLVAEHGF